MPDPSRSAALAAIARRLGLAVLLTACVTSGAVAAEPSKKDKPAPTAAAPKVATAKPPAKASRPATPASEPVPKFTNEDLPKVAAERDRDAAEEEDAGVDPAADASSSTGGKPKPKPKAGEQEADAEEEGKDFESVLGEEERAAKTVLLQRQIADAEKRIEQLQSRRRALQNALHAGLVPAGADEQEAVGGQGNDVRLAWVDEQIAATRKAMARDREELARIQAP